MKTVLITKSLIQVAAIGVILASSMMFSPLANSAEESSAQVQIPPTSDAIWHSIDKEVDLLNKAIQTGKLDNVHHHALAIRDLAEALPAHSSSLPADKLGQIKASNKFVVTLAERLDATGDANDKAGTKANFEKQKSVLRKIRSNYSE